MHKSTLLDVKGLKKYFPIEKGFFRRVTGHVRAVDDVTFSISENETFGVVGESGCGKTTLGRCVMRGLEATEGTIHLRVNEDDVVALNELNENSLWPYRRYMQMIFQDPFTSLDPRMTVMELVGEPLKYNKIAKGKELNERVVQIVEAVGLEASHVMRYPHAFSGGQRQRIGIARALSTNPKLVVCDEPVSALDVSIQAQVLNLLTTLQEQFQLSYLFISHDLSVVEHVSDRVAVMYVGKMVELAHTEELFHHPQHPYTEALLSAVPTTDLDTKPQRIILPGEIADPANPPNGCYFHPRCLYSKDICKSTEPKWEANGDNHFVACHFPL